MAEKENYDQELYLKRNSLEDLQAELKTKIGDGDLFEEDGKIFYHSNKDLYEIDFDALEKEKDLITKREASDDDDLHLRTDSVEGLCPLLKNKNKIKKSAINMTGEEKIVDYSPETDKKKSMADEKEKDETEDTEKEDMKKEEKLASEYSDLIEKLVQEEVKKVTKDFQEREKQIKEKEANEIQDFLKGDPFNISIEDLEKMDLKELQVQKSLFEKSKLYKDYIKSKEEPKTKITHEDIDKTIFKDEDFFEMGQDPWNKFKAGGKK